jgi:tetratricopeptide (TPR) repeat protein
MQTRTPIQILNASLRNFTFDRFSVHLYYHNEKMVTDIAEAKNLIKTYAQAEIYSTDTQLAYCLAMLCKQIGIFIFVVKLDLAQAKEYFDQYFKFLPQDTHSPNTETEPEVEYTNMQTLSLSVSSILRDDINILSEMQMCLPTYQRLETQYKNEKEFPSLILGRAYLMRAIASYYYHQGLKATNATAKNQMFQSAQTFTLQALQFQLIAKDTSPFVKGDVAESYHLLGNIFLTQDNKVHAYQAMTYARLYWAEFNKQINYTYHMSYQTNILLASLHLTFKNYQTSIALLEETLAQQEAFYGDDPIEEVAITLNILARAYEENNQSEPALVKIDKAIMIRTEISSPNLAQSKNFWNAIFNKKIICLNNFPRFHKHINATLKPYQENISEMEATINFLMIHTNYLNQSQQELLRERCMEISVFHSVMMVHYFQQGRTLTLFADMQAENKCANNDEKIATNLTLEAEPKSQPPSPIRRFFPQSPAPGNFKNSQNSSTHQRDIPRPKSA